jgi:uncharacterized membrane protein YkvA (DUF1232 family)
VRGLREETYALYLALRHPGTPWHVRLLAALVVGYALSPIDLIPDFVPVLGYLDDLVLLPLGIALVLRLIPADVLAECRAEARSATGRRGRAGRVAAAVIVVVWILFATVAVALVLRVVAG